MDQSLSFRREDMQRYHNDEQVVKKTAQQIIKDFGMFGMDVDFPENLHMAYNDLFDQLAPYILQLMNGDRTRFYSLLYRIDLSESSIKKGSEDMKGLLIHDVITHLILERELKKVLTRIYFSRNS